MRTGLGRSRWVTLREFQWVDTILSSFEALSVSVRPRPLGPVSPFGSARSLSSVEARSVSERPLPAGSVSLSLPLYIVYMAGCAVGQPLSYARPPA